MKGGGMALAGAMILLALLLLFLAVTSRVSAALAAIIAPQVLVPVTASKENTIPHNPPSNPNYKGGKG